MFYQNMQNMSMIQPPSMLMAPISMINFNESIESSLWMHQMS